MTRLSDAPALIQALRAVRYTGHSALALLLATAFLLFCLPSNAWEATIERDALGVPHIYGDTNADMAFGLAYAQAEDGWEILEESLPYYRGQAARFFGKDAAATDYLVQWLDFWNTIERDYDAQLSPDTKRYLDAFAAGFNVFAAAYPERVTLH